jgi:uncharacterized protein
MSKTAVITGATSGLGAAYAKRLASEGYDLVLVGRRKDVITGVADNLAAKNNIKAHVVIADLSGDSGVQQVIDAINATPDVEVLINNAGFAISKSFEELNPAEYETMVNVHQLAPMKLISAALPGMIRAGRGTIINVASIGAYLPVPRSSIYNATKAFLKLFSESLQMEVKDKGIRVQVLCPGYMETDFYRFTTEEKKKSMSRGTQKIPLDVLVDYSLKSLKGNRVVCIPGFSYKAICGLSSIMPRNLVCSMMKSAFKDF